MNAKTTHLDEHRSIEIISQMINETNADIDRESGKYFLLWGYTTTIVALFEYFMQVLSPYKTLCLWAWFLIPIVGGLGTLWLNMRNTRKIRRPKSYIDRSISAVWQVFGLAYGMVYIAALAYHTNILFLTVVLMGMATVITGKICRHRVLTVAGAVGIVLSLLFPAQHFMFETYSHVIFDGDMAQTEFLFLRYSEIAIFAVIFVIMMIIPGHILNKRAKIENNA